MSKDIFKLYSYFYSSASWRVRIGMNLKELDYEYIGVDLRKGEQFSQQYSDISKSQRVPSLVHNDNILMESSAILEYIDELRPNIQPFLRQDLYERAQIRAMAQIVNSAMQPLQNLSLVTKLSEDYKTDRVAWSLFWVEKGYQTLEKIMQEKSGIYSFGDQLSLADIFLFPQAIANRDRFNYDLTKHPNINRVVNHLLTIDAFQRSLPKFQPDFTL